MAELNIIHHINEFKKVLTYSKKIGFFFGAGSSCSFGLPTIAQLTTNVINELNPLEKADYQKAADVVRELKDGEDPTIEDILNYLRQIRDLTNGKSGLEFKGISGERASLLDKRICQEIYKNIKTKQDVADITQLRKFFAWYDATMGGFIKEIFTTNYDMLLEMAMESNYIPYYDGFAGAYEPFFNSESIECFPDNTDSTVNWIRLWKVHGSLNWMLKPANGTSEERIVRAGKLDDPKDELMIYPSKEKYTLSRKEPFIAYFDRLKKYMLNGEGVLIFSGYSFSDQHINEIIYNALRQNPRLYAAVFCYSDSQVETMESKAQTHLNLCVMGPKKVLANGTKFDWVFDDSDEDKAGNEFYWDATNKKMKLGDFKCLIEFFIDNSGRKSVIEEIANGK